jgi:hypothetical protein
MKRLGLIAGLVFVAGLLLILNQSGPDQDETLAKDPVLLSPSVTARQDLFDHEGWVCQKGLGFTSPFRYQANTQVKWSQKTQQALNAQHWYIHVKGQLQEVCLQQRASDQAWLVFYRIMPESIEQNLQESDRQLLTQLNRAFEQGVFVWRTKDQVLETHIDYQGSLPVERLWQPYMLSSMLCRINERQQRCEETWLNEIYRTTVRRQDKARPDAWVVEASWENQEGVAKDLHIDFRWPAGAKRPVQTQLRLHQLQQLPMAQSRESIDLSLAEWQAEYLTDMALGRLEERYRRLHTQVQANNQPGLSAATGLTAMYRKELGALTIEDLWQPVNEAKVDRYLKLKAWVYLNQSNLAPLRARLRDTSSFDQDVARMWLKALAHSGGEPGQRILMDLLQERQSDVPTAKYLLANLAFAEQPAAALNRELASFLEQKDLAPAVRRSAILALGTMSGRSHRQQAQQTSRLLADKWEQAASLADRVTIVQALGNAGASGSLPFLNELLATASEPRLITEILFAMRFIDEAFTTLVSQLNGAAKSPYLTGSARAIRYVDLNQSRVGEIIGQLPNLHADHRFLVLNNLLKNSSLPSTAQPLLERYLERENRNEIRNLIYRFLERKSS